MLRNSITGRGLHRMHSLVSQASVASLLSLVNSTRTLQSTLLAGRKEISARTVSRHHRAPISKASGKIHRTESSR